MLKVLQINVVNKFYSTGRTTFELGEAIEKAGMESRIAVALGEPNANVYLIGSKIEQKIHAVLSRVLGLQGYFSFWGTKKLIKYIDREQPNVIHLRNLHGNYINLPMLFRYISKREIPTVLTLHDCWFYTGKCCHYTTVKCCKWIAGDCGECPKLKDDNVSWILDKTKKMIRDKKTYMDSIKNLTVVGVSKWIAEEAKKSYVFSNAKSIRYIYNWIDEGVFCPRNQDEIKKRYNLEDKFVVLGVASGWSNKKGLDKIKELSSLLPEKMQIVLVGKCEETFDTSKIKIFQEIKETEKLAEIYSMADVYLNMSLEESFGKVSAEALMCGTPVIAFNSTANPEIVGPGCGYVLETFDIQKLLSYLEEIRENTKNKYIDDCVQFAKSNFGRERNTLQYLELYQEIQNRKGTIC